MAQPSIDIEQVAREDMEISPALPWKVIVSNDPVNLVEVVCVVFQKVLSLSEEKAMAYTLQVHNEGRAAVFSGGEEECHAKATQLMAHNLWTHVEKGE